MYNIYYYYYYYFHGFPLFFTSCRSFLEILQFLTSKCNETFITYLSIHVVSSKVGSFVSLGKVVCSCRSSAWLSFSLWKQRDDSILNLCKWEYGTVVDAFCPSCRRLVGREHEGLRFHSVSGVWIGSIQFKFIDLHSSRSPISCPMLFLMFRCRDGDLFKIHNYLIAVNYYWCYHFCGWDRDYERSSYEWLPVTGHILCSLLSLAFVLFQQELTTLDELSDCRLPFWFFFCLLWMVMMMMMTLMMVVVVVVVENKYLVFEDIFIYKLILRRNYEAYFQILIMSEKVLVPFFSFKTRFLHCDFIRSWILIFTQSYQLFLLNLPQTNWFCKESE